MLVHRRTGAREERRNYLSVSAAIVRAFAEKTAGQDKYLEDLDKRSGGPPPAPKDEEAEMLKAEAEFNAFKK